jgi:hypothetical protein
METTMGGAPPVVVVGYLFMLISTGSLPDFDGQMLTCFPAGLGIWLRV